LTTKPIEERYLKLPYGTLAAIAQDLGLSQQYVSRCIFHYTLNERVEQRVSAWLTIYNWRGIKPSYAENIAARRMRKYIKRLLVPDPESFVLVREIMGRLIEEHYSQMDSLPNKRLYVLIASNYPLEEHVTGEAIIGYRIRAEDENE
jgi:hypothetical protein